jgi:hypothetical protein
MPVEVPHFGLPFQYVNGAPLVVEQNSDEDVANCVFAVAASEPGQFLDEPEFGTADPTFEQEPVNPRQFLQPIARWEPRAVAVAETNPDLLDEAIVNATIQIEP